MEIYDQDGNELDVTEHPDGTWTLDIPRGVTSITGRPTPSDADFGEV